MKLLDSVCQIYDDTISYNLSRMNVYDARSSSEDDTDTDESDWIYLLYLVWFLH